MHAMIFDSLDNFQLYFEICPAFADIDKFITANNLAELSIGIHSINSDGAYASVNEYQTKSIEDSFIECHNKYIDVQIIAYGEEKIGIAHKKLCVEQPYCDSRDLQKLTGNVDFVTLLPGFFAVFFPHDAHEPGVRSGLEAVPVKKIVFKVPVSIMGNSCKSGIH